MPVALVLLPRLLAVAAATVLVAVMVASVVLVALAGRSWAMAVTVVSVVWVPMVGRVAPVLRVQRRP